ncbi:hypothetical protein GCM10028803_17330 [Larkinella knui]|uniref:Heparinase n=1 Tax=Larkinella knui TaxID=2025310 RepID=A0A3P1CU66_9BACT|nr:hypothetical protein [Larkinella knui]RRB16847.1 hypothetical protein EHT87_00725 [Larkinella knui]
MDRRSFVRLGTASLCSLPVLTTASFARSYATAPDTKPAWLLEVIKANDEQINQIRAYRVKESGNPAFGGIKDGEDIPNAQSTADFARRCACAISSPESTFYRSKELLSETGQAVQYLLKIQHSDGTIDLPSTNFHSTPDTGFIVKRLTTAYTLLNRSGTPGLETVLPGLKTFLQRAGEALAAGGIHTPNHRWVVSAALTKLNSLWPDARYVKRIEQWLGEHIDMDEDGQFNERSTLIYSPLTDRLLITIAKGMNKPELLDYVRRNLAMTLYYIHPNGEVVSEASGRQDKALVGTLEGYYYPARFMALRDKNGELAALCRQIEKTVLLKGVYFLDYYLEDPAFWSELPASKPLPTDYVKPFPHSGLVRIRHGNWDSTILKANPVFLTFSKGEAVLQGLRIAASFFGKGQFQTEKIEKKGDSWVLSQSLDGPYWQPYPKDGIDPAGDWEKMPRTNRKQSEVQRYEANVTIRETARGMEVDIQITGTENIPVSVELIFRSGGTLAGVTKHPTRPNAHLLSGQSGTYTVQNDTITFGPGKALHKGVVLRGALPPVEAPTVYLTGFTPFQHTIKLS